MFSLCTACWQPLAVTLLGHGIFQFSSTLHSFSFLSDRVLWAVNIQQHTTRSLVQWKQLYTETDRKHHGLPGLQNCSNCMGKYLLFWERLGPQARSHLCVPAGEIHLSLSWWALWTWPKVRRYCHHRIVWENPPIITIKGKLYAYQYISIRSLHVRPENTIGCLKFHSKTFPPPLPEDKKWGSALSQIWPATLIRNVTSNRIIWPCIGTSFFHYRAGWYFHL